MKSLLELAGELESVCQKIQREPLSGERIRLCSSVEWLSFRMQQECESERAKALAQVEREREQRGPVAIRHSDFFAVAADICDTRRNAT